MNIALVIVIGVLMVSAFITLAWISQGHEDRMLALAAQQSAERIRWAEERKELMDHTRYLNDRYLAKHAQDAVMMDKFPDAPLGNDRPRTLVPEGL